MEKNMRIRCEEVTISGLSGSAVILELVNVDSDDLIDQFSVKEVVDYFEEHRVLDHIGKERAMEYWGLVEIPG